MQIAIKSIQNINRNTLERNRNGPLNKNFSYNTASLICMYVSFSDVTVCGWLITHNKRK